MASYLYERDIKEEDLRPVREKHYTRRERWNNWWDYNLKWVLIAAVVIGFVGYSFIGQYLFTVHPDYNVAVVSPYYLPDDTLEALQTQLAAYGEDLNGDGETVVTVNVYTVDYSGGGDAYLAMAGLYAAFSPTVGLISVSIAGAVVSNIARTAVAVLWLEAPSLFVQLPFVCGFGIAAGALVGILTTLCIKYLPERLTNF